MISRLGNAGIFSVETYSGADNMDNMDTYYQQVLPLLYFSYPLILYLTITCLTRKRRDLIQREFRSTEVVLLMGQREDKEKYGYFVVVEDQIFA